MFYSTATESTFPKHYQNAFLVADCSGGKDQTAEFSYSKTCCPLDKEITQNIKIMPHTTKKRKESELALLYQIIIRKSEC